MGTLQIAVPGRRRRRRHGVEFKAAVIQARLQPGISVTSVALANGLNANMLRKWLIEAAQGFIPLELPGPAPVADIRIELWRAKIAVSVTWPRSAAAEYAAWLRELLR